MVEGFRKVSASTGASSCTAGRVMGLGLGSIQKLQDLLRSAVVLCGFLMVGSKASFFVERSRARYGTCGGHAQGTSIGNKRVPVLL